MRKIKTGYRFNEFVSNYTVIDRQGNYVLLETVPDGGARYYTIGRVFIVNNDEDVYVIPGDYTHHEGANPTDIKTPLTLEEIRLKFLKLDEDEQQKIKAEKERLAAMERAHQEAVAKASRLSKEQRLQRIYKAKDMRREALEEFGTIINYTDADTDIVELAKSKKLQQAVDRCNMWDYILSNLKS